ncbi:MAG TPA: response regulator [Silvibacterium sp.]|nr:response regulator [Silvibacterium sp.]HUN83787.1 response regulator [Terracidiphilus sp.]
MEGARHKLLVVDDERTIADTLVQIFSANGYEAHAAYSAEQAAEIVAGWVPDLIIIDVILPQMNGIDLAVLLQEQFPNCRVLLFSGQTATADLLADAEMKGHKFEILAKPVHPNDMLHAALRVLTADHPDDGSGGSAGSERSSASDVAEPTVE